MSGQAVKIVGAGLAALAALALVIAAVLLFVRSDDTAPVRIIAPVATQAPDTVASDVKVQISGEVMFPGVYRVDADDRVIDAVAAAGGLSRNADLSGINLSQRVQDEAHYHIPALGDRTPIAQSQQRESANAQGALINLNDASAQDLEVLPGIGPSLAAAIVSYREDNGPFGSVDEMDNVPGIGAKTLDAIRNLVSVSGGR